MRNVILALNIIVCLAGIVKFRKLTMPFKLFAIWLMIDLFLFYPLGRLCIAVYHNNILWYHVQSMFEYSAYAIIYYYLFINRRVKQIALYSIPILIILSIINGCFFQPFTKVFPSYLIAPEEILCAIFGILLFKQMLQYPVQLNIIKQSLFWFNTAILFFSTTMFIILSLANYFTTYKRADFMLIAYFWYSVDIILNILFLLAILNDNNNKAIKKWGQIAT
jgi:hypothetical protein